MNFSPSSNLLDACVLGLLRREDTYGYILTQNIKDIMNVSESTLYPVLKRLQQNGYLKTYDQSYQGRNRRYYAITELGQDAFLSYCQEWNQYKKRLDRILKEGKK